MENLIIVLITFFPLMLFVFNRELLFEDEFYLLIIFFDVAAFAMSLYKHNELIIVGFKLPLITHLIYLFLYFLYLKIFKRKWMDTFFTTEHVLWIDSIFNASYILISSLAFVALLIAYQ